MTCLKANKLTPVMNDEDRFKLAMNMSEAGNYESALQHLDYLVMKYPDNWDYLYERAYANAAMQRYDKAIKDCEVLTKMKDCKWLAYQMWGSCLDDQNKPNEALDVFRKGIERFPDAAYLYMEMGTTYNRRKYYDEAIYWYDKAIEISPDFQSAYFRAAAPYANTGNKAWSLIYAETAIMLRSDNMELYKKMSGLIRNVYENSITAKGDSLSIELYKSRGIQILKDDNDDTDPLIKKNTLLAFSGVYEGCLTTALTLDNTKYKDPADVLTLSGLTQIRRGAVETYYNITDNLFGNSMYLLEFQKAVIDAGHWDAYNAYIFLPAFPDEAGKWFVDHSKESEAFINWCNDSPFKLDKHHTVGALTITRDQRRLTMLEALRMLADLSGGIKK